MLVDCCGIHSGHSCHLFMLFTLKIKCVLMVGSISNSENKPRPLCFSLGDFLRLCPGMGLPLHPGSMEHQPCFSPFPGRLSSSPSPRRPHRSLCEPGQPWLRAGWAWLEAEGTQTLREGAGSEAQAAGGDWEARQLATGKDISATGRSHCQGESGTALSEAWGKRMFAGRIFPWGGEAQSSFRGRSRPQSPSLALPPRRLLGAGPADGTGHPVQQHPWFIGCLNAFL